MNDKNINIYSIIHKNIIFIDKYTSYNYTKHIQINKYYL